MEVEDKILIMRGIIGVISGSISILFNSSISILMLLLSFYLFSAMLSLFLFKQKKMWNIFGKGTAIYVATWFLSLIIIYNFTLR
ncbi:hypothetical protein V6M85_10735 [Sulfolobus tengchongensis]|uniref:DUF3953 domain-containing protein n=1 Tax=Sulfolobus tengchongensis TaxID=207809 RepID=A0AAX4KZK6_9CREN